MLFDLLGKELQDKYDVEDMKKSKKLLKRFKQKHSKASVKPSGAGTADIYTPSWEFYEQLKYLTVICDDTDDTVNSISEPSKPKVKRASKQQQRDSREDRKLELFSEAVVAMRQPEKQQGQNSSIENSEVAGFANYVRVTLLKLNPRKFRRAKRCIGDILFDIEESEWSLPVLLKLDLAHTADTALPQLLVLSLTFFHRVAAETTKFAKCWS